MRRLPDGDFTRRDFEARNYYKLIFYRDGGQLPPSLYGSVDCSPALPLDRTKPDLKAGKMEKTYKSTANELLELLTKFSGQNAPGWRQNEKEPLTINIILPNQTTHQIEPQTDLIDADSACRILNIGKSLFYSQKRRGVLPPEIKIGRRRLWRRSELEAYVEAGCPERWNLSKRGSK